MSAQQQLAAVIEGLEAQRALLGDAVVDMALAPLRARLAALSATPTAEAVAALALPMCMSIRSGSRSQRPAPTARRARPA